MSQGGETSAALALRDLRSRSGLTRDELAKRMGYSSGSALKRYESPDYWTEPGFPADFCAKLQSALAGLGEPPIQVHEIWRLSAGEARVVAMQGALVTVPVVEWGRLMSLAEAGAVIVAPAAFIQVPGPMEGEVFASVLEDDHASAVAPRGSTVIVNASDRSLTHGARYLVAIDGTPRLVRYIASPPHFAFDAIRPEDWPPVYLRGAPVVLGRAIRAIFPL